MAVTGAGRKGGHHRAAAGAQLSLLDYRAHVEAFQWPSGERFPHNEGQRAGDIIQVDLSSGGEVTIVTGYASLLQVVEFLAHRAASSDPAGVRLLFGNEPFRNNAVSKLTRNRPLPDDIRDYWLHRNISPSSCGAVLDAIEFVRRDSVAVRTAPTGRALHAKMYVTNQAVILGSSNFTPAGLGHQKQSEANVRFTATEPERFAEARTLADGLWDAGAEYKDGLIALLEELLRPVKWEEALARACAVLLETQIARDYRTLLDLDGIQPPLWPHQLEGINQALWVLDTVGSVLIADATGAGKTRLGAWVLRGAFDLQVRQGGLAPAAPVPVVPPAVTDAWVKALAEPRLTWSVESHGSLSQPTARRHDGLMTSIGRTDLLAVDEAHNFINPSDRTRRLQTHLSDRTVLFTATPLNRALADLVGIAELLGLDNLTDEVDQLVREFRRRGLRDQDPRAEVARRQLRDAIKAFTVRRSRRVLDEKARAAPEQYRLGENRYARYPKHTALFYDVPGTADDRLLASQIDVASRRLTGILRFPEELKTPRSFEWRGLDDLQYIQQLVASIAGLARYQVMKALRSSRAALCELIFGTDVAWESYAAAGSATKKDAVGDVVGQLRSRSGQMPAWKLSLDREDPAVPKWLWDRDAHVAACAEDEAAYREIGLLLGRMSNTREEAKCTRLASLLGENPVLVYDSHVISLELFHQRLLELGFEAEVFIGSGGAKAKRRAEARLGLRGKGAPCIALCTDALSEGMNLQRPSNVVHLDTPTVIRTAEQRAGRVDRMDSPHDEIGVWWPRDPPEFAPGKRNLLAERLELARQTVGVNVVLPREDVEESLSIEALAEEARLDRASDEAFHVHDVFQAVRELIGEGGLISQSAYDAIRTSVARMRCRVSLVRSARQWAFVVLRGRETASRWLFLDEGSEKPTLDLDAVAALLRERLGPQVESLPWHLVDKALVERFEQRIEMQERELLPMRRQRALRLCAKVLQAWTGVRDLPPERRRLLESVGDLLVGDTGADHADPHWVADRWLTTIQGHRQRALERLRARRDSNRLAAVEKLLIEDPLSNEALQAAFADAPMLQRARERIVVMIVGVPPDPAADVVG